MNNKFNYWFGIKEKDSISISETQYHKIKGYLFKSKIDFIENVEYSFAETFKISTYEIKVEDFLLLPILRNLL